MKENFLVSFTRDPPMRYWETILEIPFPQLFMCFRLQLRQHLFAPKLSCFFFSTFFLSHPFHPDNPFSIFLLLQTIITLWLTVLSDFLTHPGCCWFFALLGLQILHYKNSKCRMLIIMFCMSSFSVQIPSTQPQYLEHSRCLTMGPRGRKRKEGWSKRKGKPD